MPDRKRLVITLWLASSLALLATLQVAPIRTSPIVTDSSRPDRLRHDYALPPCQPTTFLGVAIATDTVPRVSALPFENEEQEWDDALDEPRVAFLITRSFRKIADRQSIAPRSILSYYPLRS